MLISEIMALDTITVSDTATLSEATRIMDENKIRHLPVVRGDSLVGMISDRDLLEAVGWLVPREAEELEAGPVIVGDAMQVELLTVEPETSISRAAAMLIEWGVNSLPVARSRALVGLVTSIDILDTLVASSRYGRLSGADDPPVEKAMAKELVTIDEKTTLAEVAQILAAKDIRHLPVVSSDRLVGIFSDRDLRRATGRGEPKDTAVADLMTRQVSSIALDTPISRVARQMAREKIGALPVEDGDGRLVGMVTITDVLGHCVRVLDEDGAEEF